MNLKKKNIKIVSIILTLTLIISMFSPVFGHSQNVKSPFIVMELNTNSYLITNQKENSSAILKIEENSHMAKISIKKSNKKNSGYMYWDKDNKTIYSSFTNTTTSVSELKKECLIENSNNEDISESNDELISLFQSKKNLSRKVVSSKKIKISYKTLHKYVTSTSDMFDLAVAIVTLVGLIMGVSIATGPGGVIAMITIISFAITHGIKKASSKHGIYVKVNKNRIIKIQGGKKTPIYRYTIAKIWRY